MRQWVGVGGRHIDTETQTNERDTIISLRDEEATQPEVGGGDESGPRDVVRGVLGQLNLEEARVGDGQLVVPAPAPGNLEGRGPVLGTGQAGSAPREADEQGPVCVGHGAEGTPEATHLGEGRRWRRE
jgi:hypothetical protein